MLNSLLQSTQVSILQKALSAASLRHKVISNNIANVNTPKFKRSEVSFENELAAAMNSKSTSASSLLARTHERHLPLQSKTQTSGLNVEPTVNTITANSFRTDDNNVDIDSEMAGLAKNNIYYSSVADQINKYFSNIKSAINGGK